MSNASQNATVRPTLSLGSTGEDVKDLQKFLNRTVADNTLVVDGKFGQITQKAVIFFQQQYGLTLDGIVSSHTWEVIDTIIVHSTLCRDSRGEDVEYLQGRLNSIGFGYLVIDGIFGLATEEAVQKFQKYYGLTVDGIVGIQTWAQLEAIDVQGLIY